MHCQLASALLLTLVAQGSARSIHSKRVSGTISTSFTDRSAGASFGATDVQSIINAGVKVWLSGDGGHTLYGNIQNSGSLVISQTDAVSSPLYGRAVEWEGAGASNGNLINNAGASILLNDVSASSSSSARWYIQSMNNAGTIQWCGRGNAVSYLYNLISKGSSVNSGLLVFEQKSGDTGMLAAWSNEVLDSTTGTPSATLTNNGGVLVRSMQVTLRQNFFGDGCWMIGNAATLYLQSGVRVFQNPTRGPALAGQSIAFLDGTGTLHLDELVYQSTAFNFGASIFGFGAGNKLEFSQEITSWTYFSDILEILFVNGKFAYFTIGTGYSADGFFRASGPVWNFIGYSGVVPIFSPPAKCLMSVPVCAPLLSDLSVSSALSSSTAPAASSSATPATTLSTASVSGSTSSAVVPPATSLISSSTTSIAVPAISSTTSNEAPIVTSSTISSEAPPVTTLMTAIPTTTSEGSPISSLLGCFQDSAQFGGVRTFNGPSYVDTNGLTNQACASFCTSKGFPISATEYSQECYCGGEVPTTGSAVCSKPCSGDPTQICGGDWALSVSRTSNVPVNSVSSAPSPSVTAIDYIPFKYDGQLAGCFADAAETGDVRTLSGATYRDSSSLTNEKCANFCGDKGFAYSGTEDGQECWCSSTLPTVSSTRCDAACKGNTTQTCGGPWALIVTINQAIVEQSSSATPSQPPFTALGCFADSVNARVFSGFSYTNSSVTPAQCAAKCSSLLFPFSGTEFGNECFCSSVAPAAASTQCNKPCAGNSILLCGGPDAMTVYRDESLPVIADYTCPGIPAGFVFCMEGQRVSGGRCVSA